MNKLFLQKLKVSKFSLGIILFFIFGWFIVNISEEFSMFFGTSVIIFLLFAIYFPIFYKLKKSKFSNILKYTSISYYLLFVIYCFTLNCIVPIDYDFFSNQSIPEEYLIFPLAPQVIFPISLLFEKMQSHLSLWIYKFILFICLLLEIMILFIIPFWLFIPGFLLNIITFFLFIKLEKINEY